MIVETKFCIPPEIAARVLTGDLIRHGGVVRDPSGRLVIHLKEISPPTPSEDAIAAAAGMLTGPIVIAGLATLAVIGTATAIVRKRKRALAECVKNDDSLRAYLEAARSQSLTAEIIDRLIADLDAIKASFESGNITVDLSTEQSETLVRGVIDYARRRPEADSVDLDEPPQSIPSSADAAVMDLRRCLAERGGSVEVFADEAGAKARMDFIQSVVKGMPAVGEYDYVKGAVLVRVSRFLTPDQAKEYQAALSG